HHTRPPMQHRHFLLALIPLLIATSAPAVEPSELKPGLIATHADRAIADGVPQVWRLEPTVALTLGAGEQPHPRLGKGTVSRWIGYINVTRAGKYTFSANVQNGTFVLHVGNQNTVVDANVGAQETKFVAGREITLDGGVYPITALHVRAEGTPSRVEL